MINRFLNLLVFLAAGSSIPLLGAALSVGDLRCEYRENPAGLDVPQPRLSWTLASAVRGQRQTAYQVLVATSPENLARDEGDLWDSGKRASDQTVHVVYEGKPLHSRVQAWWKVRVWDKEGQAAGWSGAAQWSMGLLEKSDWQARWIADAPSMARAEAEAVRPPHNGFHSQFAADPGMPKWVVIDLGQRRDIDALRLHPARPYDWQADVPGFLFPVRFKVELAENPNFQDARLVVDQTREDLPNPGTNAPVFRFDLAAGQFIRLMVTRLGRREGTNYGIALAEMEVLKGDQNLAKGAKVTASDSIETGAWAKTNLVDGRTRSERGGAPAKPLPATMVRKEFALDGAVKRATVYVTGLGLYELRLNGQRVGGQLLAPEWTNYRKRIQYQIYEVTQLLRPGSNAIGAMLDEGWYAGRLMTVPRNGYGSYCRFLMQLEIEFSDGKIQTIATDGTWRGTHDGPIRHSGIYDGEEYDARKEMPGWDQPGFADSGWEPVKAFPLDQARLVWQPNEPIQVVREFKPLAITEPKPGVYVFDLGQNMVGWCRLILQGRAGEPMVIRHAEMLNDDGTIYTANLRGAPQVDRYIPRDESEVIYEPRFTYHGFRFVEVTGLAKPPTPETVLGRVFHSAAPDAGRFASSSPLLNQLMHNIVWTQRGNLMSSPNDCPQRDERFGWMGDIQAFSQTAIFNLDMAAFFNKWIRDIRDDQADDGRYPDFAPHPGDPNASFSGVPAWGDAGTVVPWRMYQNYGDLQVLREHFESARRWVDYIQRKNPNLIWSEGRNNNYNDWLNGDTLIMKDWPRKGGAIPPDVFATAFFAHSTEIVARMAEVLGRAEEAKRYGEWFGKIKAAFNQKFVQPDGRIEGDTQAGYALALHFNLLSEELRPKAMEHLLAGIQRYHGHLSTGIQTSHRLMLELTRNGQHDEAWRILNLKDFPSWGMMIENGATTIWERWDGYVKGRGFQDPGMNSFNHWAFGAIGEWIWRELVGINPDEANPGFKHFLIRPRPVSGLDWVKGEYRSIRGRIASDWKVNKSELVLNLVVPPGTRATVYVPAKDAQAVEEGGKPVAQAPGVNWLKNEDGAAIYSVQSGSYTFVSKRWK